MPEDPRSEPHMALQALIEQIGDDSIPAVSRVASAIASQAYFEAILRDLVSQARKEGASWDDLGQVFVTSAANVQARFGSYRQYDDEDDDEE